jgi:hypothetical protein
VIDDAEAEAQRHLTDARAEADLIVAERLSSLAELTDSLIAQADAIRRQSERLLESLEEAKTQIDSAERPESASRGSHLSAVAPVDEPEDEASERGGSAGARLLATQMAVSGSSREEIAARLRNGFEVDDTDAILDAILGPED